MIRFISVLLAASALNLVSVHAAPVIQPNDSIAICGDSITEQKLYSVFMEEYLLMCQPTQGQTIAQFGWGGEQAPGFLARLDTDVYPFKPTVATTCYGMNDGHYAAMTPDTSDTYRKAQTAIVDSFKQHGVRVIILGSAKCVDSFYFHNDPAQAVIYNKTLGELGDIDKDIAQKEGVIYADVYGATTAAMLKSKAALGEKYIFAGGDGVHPGPNGHLVMAYAYLKALGCDGNIGTITINFGLQQADASPGQKIISYKDGTVTVESTRYPFCFDGDPTQPDQNDANIIKYFPFNEELNRYMLVVKGLTAAKSKVTWGSDTKEFTKEQLDAGINLAAEFLHNPFGDAFHKVAAAVQNQQNFETDLVKNFLHNIPDFKQMAPKSSSSLDAMAAEGVEHARTLFQASAAAVTPVQHTITVVQEP